MNERIKVFIVEDEALIAEEIRRSLDGLGYEVCTICYKYEKAAAAIPLSDADLFVFDINLNGSSGQDGIALAGILKETNPKPFIFLTAYNDKDTIEKAIALHPSNYLLKPVNPVSLFVAIQLAIAREQDGETDVVLNKETDPDFFYVKMGTRTTKLYWQDVYSIIRGKNYVRVFVSGHAVGYPLRGTLNFVMEELVPKQLRDRFFRSCRNTCLNKTFVTAATNEVITCGGQDFENISHVSPADLVRS